MATIYIRDESGKEFLTNQLKIASARIVTQDMLQGTAAEGEVGAENIQEEFDIDNLNINSAPGMLLSATVINAVAQYIETTIQSLIADNATNILDKLGINEETLDMTNQILGIIDSAVFKLNSILTFVPTNIKTIPSGEAMTSTITTSLKDMYMAVWLNVQKQYNTTINDAIMNLPTAQEALKDSLEALQSLALNLINQQCIRYTGKSLVELRYMCNKIINTYNKWKERKRKSRQGIDEETKTEYEFNVAEIKAELLEQLSQCSDLLFNSFMILEIKESIENIMQLVNEFNNVDVNVLAEGINSFEDFMDLLVELGLDNKSNIITLKDAIKSGINQIRNNYNGLLTQFAAQGLASAAQLAITASKNIDTSTITTITQNYSFDLDIETNTLFIIFDREPTTKHIIKNLTSALTHAENDDKEKIFNANQIQQILNLIDKGVFEQKDQELEIGVFNIRIKFNLENYNKKEETNQGVNKTAMKLAQEALNDYYARIEEINAAREQEAAEAYREFSLGVVTEEYTIDPVDVKKRPTLQLVHELYDILKEFFPLLKIVITLVQNYKINKEKVKNNSQGNLLGMIRFLAKANKLLNIINLDDSNFYTVRTLKTYHFIINNIKPYDASISNMGLSVEETVKLYDFLTENNLDTTEINPELYSVIYFDMDSINEQQEEFKEAADTATGFFGDDSSLFVTYPEAKYSDGTMMGLDKVKKAGNEIYYSNSSLPLIASQILRSYSKNLDVSF